jgi:hypothetical protein
MGKDTIPGEGAEVGNADPNRNMAIGSPKEVQSRMGKRNQWRPKVAESAESAENAITGDPTASNPTPPLGANPVSNAQPEARNGANPPMPEPNPQGQANPTPPTPDLTSFVANLSPGQLEKIRALAASAGIATGPQKGPNGGLLVTVEIPPEAVDPLRTWAEESGTSFQEFVSKVAGDAIVNYCFGDWSAVREAPIAAPAATTTTTTTTAGA